MARSLRSRKPFFKHPEDEFILETKSKTKSVVKSVTVPKKTGIQRDEADAVDDRVLQGSKNGSTKGNLHTGWKTVKAIETPVLRDRTNIPAERLKVDILMKQGIGEGNVKKAAKSSKRAIATPASKTDDKEDVKKMSSVRGTRKMSSKQSTDGGDTKETLENGDKANTARSDEKPKTSLRPARKTVKSATSAMKDVKNAKQTKSPETTRKTSKDIRSKDDSESVGEAENPESAKVETAAKGSGVVKKSLRSTTRIVKSTESAKNDEKSVKTMYSPKITRKTSGKVEAAKKSSAHSTEAKEKVAKNDDAQEIATEKRSGPLTKKLAKRATSKRISSMKKSEESVDHVKKMPQRPSRVRFDDKDREVDEKPSVKKKFFKSKAAIEGSQMETSVKKTVTGKRRNIGTRRSARMSVSFRARQMTLDESFAKQASRKILRRRDAARNYCEDTIIAKKNVPENDETVGDGKKTLPVYKSVKLQDNSVNDENEVYEFKFDKNDSREKLPKKKRKKVVRIQGGTKKSRIPSVTKKVTSSKIRAIPKITEAKIVDDKLEKMDVVEPVTTNLDVPTSSRQVKNDESPVAEKAPTALPIMEKENSKAVQKQAAKPTVIDSMELRGTDRLNLVSTPVLSKSSDVKPRNVLRASKQFGIMLNHALLNKSISPISKAIENFDPGSPWRPPTFTGQEFSRVKNIVQSTPQVRSFAAKLEDGASNVKNEVACKPVVSSKRESFVTENKGKTQISSQRSPSNVLTAAKSPRKFGTEISNVNNSPANSTRIVETLNKSNTREGVVAKQTTFPTPIGAMVSITRDDTISHEQTEPMNVDDENGNKENCHSSSQSPQKSPLKVYQRSPLKHLNKSPMKNLQKSPLKNPKRAISALVTRKSPSKTSVDENASPQDGPSSSKATEAGDDSRILRQSNLDNFLNLDEMPKSTRISTTHGIFDDPYSGPISGPKLLRKTEKDPSIDNAFGFDECDDSDIDVASVGRNGRNILASARPLVGNEENARGGKNDPATARLSVGEIKKHLLPTQKRAKVRKEPMIIERIEEEEKECRDENEERAIEANEKTRDPIDPTATSDAPPENSESVESSKEVPLFADLEEPPHFKQAPRYSYKRKRVGFVFSEDEDHDENSPPDGNRGTKKRKVSKVEREREKQMENWAKDLNQTFEEIDHFDLVVE